MATSEKSAEASTGDETEAFYPFVCGICNDKFDKVAKFYKHLKTHKKFGEAQNNTAILDALSIAEKVDENVFKCGVCNVSFPSMGLLHEHMLEEEDISSYTYCEQDHTARPNKPAAAPTTTQQTTSVSEDAEEVDKVVTSRRGRPAKAKPNATPGSVQSTKLAPKRSTLVRKRKTDVDFLLENSEQIPDKKVIKIETDSKSTESGDIDVDPSPGFRYSTRRRSSPKKKVNYKALAGYGKDNSSDNDEFEETSTKPGKKTAKKTTEEEEEQVIESDGEGDPEDTTQQADDIIINLEDVPSSGTGKKIKGARASADPMANHKDTSDKDGQSNCTLAKDGQSNSTLAKDGQTLPQSNGTLAKATPKQKYEGVKVVLKVDGSELIRHEPRPSRRRPIYNVSVATSKSTGEGNEERSSTIEEQSASAINQLAEDLAGNEDYDIAVVSIEEGSAGDEESKTASVQISHRKKMKTHLYFTCNICGIVLTARSLKKHEHVHMTESSVACRFCGKKFKSGLYRANHIRCVHKQTTLRCKHCNKVYKGKQTMERHLALHVLKKELQPDTVDVSMCEEVAPDANVSHEDEMGSFDVVTGQMATVINENMEVIPPSEDLLKQSYEGKLSPKVRPNAPMVNCTLCGVEFAHMKSFRRHFKKIHYRNSYKCKVCGFVTRLWKQFDIHIKNHIEEGEIYCLVGNTKAEALKKTSDENLYNNMDEVAEMVEDDDNNLNAGNEDKESLTAKAGKASEKDGKVELKEEVDQNVNDSKSDAENGDDDGNPDTDMETSNPEADPEADVADQDEALDDTAEDFEENYEEMEVTEVEEIKEANMPEDLDELVAELVEGTDVVPCGLCNRLYKSTAHLDMHVKNFHKNYYGCSVCGEKVKNRQSHRLKHLNKDDKYYSEEVVKQLQEENRKDREMIKKLSSIKKEGASGERLVECEICGKTIKAKRLNRHIEIHTDTKEHQCGICGKFYKSKRYLKDHLKKTHDNSDMMTCHICGNSYKGKRYMEIHMQTHGPKDKLCSYCGKGFTTALYLKTHMQTHLEKKSFKCTECGAGFSHRTRLMIHLAEVHNQGEQKACKYCSTMFPSRQKARIHERRVHELFKPKKRIKNRRQNYRIVENEELGYYVVNRDNDSDDPKKMFVSYVGADGKAVVGKTNKVITINPSEPGQSVTMQNENFAIENDGEEIIIKADGAPDNRLTEQGENVAVGEDYELVEITNGETGESFVIQESSVATETDVETAVATAIVEQGGDGEGGAVVTAVDKEFEEQVLEMEIPEDAQQCQIILYPDGTFKLLNVTDGSTVHT